MKKRVKLLSFILILLLMLSGCLSGQSPVPTPVATPESTATATPAVTQTPEVTPTPVSTPEPTPTPAPIPTEVEGELRVHFLDVGQADCALLECGGQSMLIDGGNVKDSSKVVAYLKQQNISHLDYMICTHAHEDHVGGLSGPLNTCTVGAVYAPVTQYDSKAFESFVKYTEKQGLAITVPKADDVFTLGGAAVRVLGPRKEYEEPNNTSIVLRVDFGATSFLFTGDMELEAERDLVDAGCELDADVLKVGHHGSNTSTGYVFLREVMPQYAVISTGAGNSYEHPRADVLSRLRDAETTVYRTDELGTILAVSDGTQIKFSAVEKPKPSPAPMPEPTQTQSGSAAYIGNSKSMAFHLPSCRNLPAEHNRVSLPSREEAISAGYRPCGNCNP